MKRVPERPLSSLSNSLPLTLALVVLSACATTVPSFLDRNALDHPQVAIDLLRLEVRQNPKRAELRSRLLQIEGEYSIQLQAQVRGRIEARDLTGGRFLLDAARAYVEPARYAELERALEREQEALEGAMEAALTAYYAQDFDSYLDDHQAATAADGDNYILRHFHERATSQSFERHLDLAQSTLERDELTAARDHAAIAQRRLPSDGPARELGAKIEREITVDEAIAQAEALACEGHRPEDRAHFLMQVQVAENAIEDHRKTQACLGRHLQAFDEPLIDTLEAVLDSADTDQREVLAAALLVSRLRSVPAQTAAKLMSGLAARYRAHCERVCSEQERLGNEMLHALASPAFDAAIETAPDFLVSDSDLDGAPLANDERQALREAIARVGAGYHAAQGRPFTVTIELAGFQSEVVNEEDEPEGRASQYVSGFRMVDNPHYSSLRSQIAQKEAELPSARSKDETIRKAADLYKKKNTNLQSQFGANLVQSFVARNESDLLGEIGTLQGKLSQTPAQLREDTYTSYNYSHRIHRGRASASFEVVVHLPNEEVQRRQIRYANAYEDDEVFAVHVDDAGGVQPKVAKVPERRELLAELKAALARKLASFLDGDLASWLEHPYRGDPSAAWSEDRRREYIATRILHQERKPDAGERAALGEFYTVSVLNASSSIDRSQLVPVLTFDPHDVDIAPCWQVADSSWERAGLRPGDQVWACNGEDVPAEITFELMVCEALADGEELHMDVLRRGELVELSFLPELDARVPRFEFSAATEHGP